MLSCLQGVLRRPQHVHRLDAPTGGLLVVAKTQEALTTLCVAFAERCAVPKSLLCLSDLTLHQSAAVMKHGLVPGSFLRSRLHI